MTFDVASGQVLDRAERRSQVELARWSGRSCPIWNRCGRSRRRRRRGTRPPRRPITRPSSSRITLSSRAPYPRPRDDVPVRSVGEPSRFLAPLYTNSSGGGATTAVRSNRRGLSGLRFGGRHVGPGVATHGAFAHVTFERSFARVDRARPRRACPLERKADRIGGEAHAEPRRAAPRTRAGGSSRARRCFAPPWPRARRRRATHTSLRRSRAPACSRSSPLAAPHSASCFRPARSPCR